MHKGLSLTVFAMLGCGTELPLPTDLMECPSHGAASTPRTPTRCDDPMRGRELCSSPSRSSLAINGNGFFVLSTPRGLRFTRWGQFVVDFDGFFASAEGYRVQGLSAEKALTPLRVHPVKALAQATNTVRFEATLDPNATIITFDPLDPVNTANFNASITVFDSEGAMHDVTVYFNRTASGAWDWRGLIPDGVELTGGTAGVPSEIAKGRLNFDAQGRLDAVTQTSRFNPAHAINPQPLRFDFGDPLSAGGTGLEGVVLGVSDSREELTSAAQDGSGPGPRITFSVDVQGRVIGEFNGVTAELARVALASFASPRGLHRDSDGTFAETKDSGGPSIGAPAEWLFGSIRARSLEQPCQP